MWWKCPFLKLEEPQHLSVCKLIRFIFWDTKNLFIGYRQTTFMHSLYQIPLSSEVLNCYSHKEGQHWFKFSVMSTILTLFHSINFYNVENDLVFLKKVKGERVTPNWNVSLDTTEIKSYEKKIVPTKSRVQPYGIQNIWLICTIINIC